MSNLAILQQCPSAWTNQTGFLYNCTKYAPDFLITPGGIINITTYPPDTLCIDSGGAVGIATDDYLNGDFIPTNNPCFGGDCCSNAPVTPAMIDYLNITNTKSYFQAYCVNPASDDDCPYGYCPNPDVAGVLVRLSQYVTSLCLSVLLFYSPEDAQTAFWAQMITVYSMIAGVGISIIRSDITRFHSVVAVVMIGSPLNFYLIVYAVISFWYSKHRLVVLFGPGRIINRVFVIVAGALWITLLAITFSDGYKKNFKQISCDDGNLTGAISRLAYVFPFFVIPVLSAGVDVAFLLPICLTIIGWIVAIVLQRKYIWRQGERWSPHFGRIWSITGREYSFIHFMLIGVIPTAYWITVIELACVYSSDDAEVPASYGQILALFVALPPLVSVSMLTPRCIQWFLGLAWVKFLRRSVTGRRELEQLPTTSNLPSPQLSVDAEGMTLSSATWGDKGRKEMATDEKVQFLSGIDK
ncbi:hypothetical protein C8Q75DRAFT_746302 [Abortiporus biennis]|nr:hypothetical protein C8Q75DRAFT_746302 [Abortiporus biennis]